MPRLFWNVSVPTLGLTAACLIASFTWTLRWLRRRTGGQKEIREDPVATSGPETKEADIIIPCSSAAADTTGCSSSAAENSVEEKKPLVPCSSASADTTSCSSSAAENSVEEKKALFEVDVGEQDDVQPSHLPAEGLDTEKSRAERVSDSVGSAAGTTPDRVGKQFDFAPTDRRAESSVAEGTPPAMCLTCGKYDGKLFRCSRCQSVCFCSVECQRVAWRTHKSDCARLAQAKHDKASGTAASKASERGTSQTDEDSVLQQSGTLSSDPAIAQHQERGIRHFHSGQYAEALAAFEQMKTSAKAAKSVNDEGRALRLVGDALDKLDSPPNDVEDAYKSALRIAHQKDDMELSYYCLTGMATHACKVDDADLAEHFYLQALTLAQRVLTQYEEGLAEGKLAMCLSRTPERRVESITHFRKAIALQKGFAHKKSALHSSLASALSTTGKTKEAHVEYRRALDLARESGNREVEMAVLTDLAALYEQVEPERARECRDMLAALNT